MEISIQEIPSVGKQPSAASKKDVIKVENLSVGYFQQNAPRPLLNNLNFSIKEGEIVSLVGKSGTGKTTLLRTLMGFEKAISGHSSILGQPVYELYGSGKVQYLHQEPILWDHLTPSKTLDLAQRLLSGKANSKLSSELIKKTGLRKEEQNGTYSFELSLGSKARLSLARAFCGTPQLLLLDEPFASVDYARREALSRKLLELARESNTALLWVTHDITEALRYSDYVYSISGSEKQLHSFKIPLSDTVPDPNRFSDQYIKYRDEIRASIE